MTFYLVCVPALAGGAIGLMVYAVRPFLPRGRAEQEERESGDPLERLGEFLEAVPIPGAAASIWGGEVVRPRLIQAGVPWTPNALATARWLALWVGLASAVLLLLRGLGLLGWFLAIFLALLGWLAIPVWLRLRAEDRRQEVDRALPSFLDRLSLGLEAGLGFEVALRRTAERFGGLLGDEMRRAVRFLDRGHPKDQVLERLVERTPSRDLRAFVASVKQSERLGTSLTKTLRVQSDLLRSRRQRRAEEASRRLPILIVFPLVFFFLPALLIIYLAPPLLHLFLSR